MQSRREYSNFEEVISGAPGPSPWYLLHSGPRLSSRHGELQWRDAVSEVPQTTSVVYTSPASGKVLLVTPGNQTLAVFDFYCYVSAMKGTRFLVWFEQKSAIGASITPSAATRLELLDADRLEVIEDLETACRELTMRKDRSRVWHRGGEVSACSVPAYLPAGTHGLPLPPELQEIDELLILAHCTAIADMNLALFIVRPREDTVEVIPQDWFNKGDYDFGYQWPTRVARDPVTRNIFGEGFRLGRFVLDETGRRIEQWLQPDPFWHPERQMHEEADPD